MPTFHNNCMNYIDSDEPDTRPGAYYVTCIDGSRWALLSGPYDTHAKALEMVEPARRILNELDGRSHWYAFGTCRQAPWEPGDKPLPTGKLQDFGYTLNLQAIEAGEMIG